MIINLKEKYEKESGKMTKEFGLKNKMQLPVVEKVVINAGIGKILGSTDPGQRDKVLEKISNDLALITGQKPVIRTSKKAISSFRLRKGMPVGLKVTLRGKRMYDFLDRLIHIVLPRVRDFKGIDLNAFDKQGNLNIGFRDQTVFPEVSPEKLIFGLEATIVVRRVKNRDQAIKFFRMLGFPIKKE